MRIAVAAAAFALIAPFIAIVGAGSAFAACYNPNSEWPMGPPTDVPPCPMKKVLTSCAWGDTWGPQCGRDCSVNFDMQGRQIPVDPSCRTAKRWIYVGEDGTYMGMVPGQDGSPPRAPRPPGTPGSGRPSGAQRYLADLSRFVHPDVGPDRLVELGNLACSARRRGMSSDDASMAVWEELKGSGLVSNMAETGTIVSVAVENLCPEVGYP